MSGFQGYRLMLQDNVDLKLLVRSRNRLPSVPFRQDPLLEASVLISAWVDITEPLTSDISHNCSAHVKNKCK